jgi:glutathionylspermidine synthase
VVLNKLYDKISIPERFAQYVERSWRAPQPTLYGRFDLWYDGKSEPKLLEFNADTPTALFEASVVQYYWLQDFRPRKDQFNSIHEKLLEVMEEVIKRYAGWNPLHFSCVRDSLEDYTTVEYMRDVAIQAGLKTKHLFIDEVGYNFDESRFVDLENDEIKLMFKLYPWEWVISEAFADQLLGSSLTLLEPAWKMILSNKAILPLLWEMYPGHKNLLPSYFEMYQTSVPYVQKPFFSREGEGIVVDKRFRQTPQVIYQEYKELPDFGGNYPVIGSWVIGAKSAGIGIREDTNPITNNKSRFVPHLFEP